MDGKRLTPYEVQGKGNCLFLSLAAAMNYAKGTHWTGVELRKQVCSLVSPENRNKNMEVERLKEVLVFDDEKVEDYWSDPSVYAEVDFVCFASIVLKIAIRVVSPVAIYEFDTSTVVQMEFHDKIYVYLHLYNSPRHASGKVNHFCPLLPEIGFGTGGCHVPVMQTPLGNVEDPMSNDLSAVVVDDSSLDEVTASTKSCNVKKKGKKGKKKKSQSCPFGCDNEYISPIGLKIHLESLHKDNLHDVSLDLKKWLKVDFCARCKKLVGLKNRHRCNDGSQRLASEMDDLEESLNSQFSSESGVRSDEEMENLDFNLDEIQFRFPPTIPHKLRLRMAHMMADILRRLITDFNNLPLWKELLSFFCLTLNIAGEEDASLCQKITRNLDLFETDRKELLSLFRKKTFTSGDLDQVRLACIRIENGRAGKAIRALQSGKIAPQNDRNLKVLQQKHPISEEEIEPEEERCKRVDIVVTPDMALKTLKEFDPTCSAGLSGFSPRFLLELVNADPTNNILKFFGRLMTRLINAKKVDKPVRDLLMRCRLTALEKDKLLQDGDCDLRPIAVGELIRRWISKIALRVISGKSRNFFLPQQFGLGISCGNEMIVNGVRFFFEHLSSLPEFQDFVLVQLDFENAYNTCSRKLFLNLVFKHFPEIFPWVRLCYASDSELLWFDQSVISASGTQQGDPLGPLLFAICLYPLLLELKKLGKQFWFLDDGSLLIPKSSLQSLFQILEKHTTSNLLRVSYKKSLLYHPDPNVFGTSSTQEGEYKISESVSVPFSSRGVVLLGSAIGCPEFIEEFLSKKIEDYRIICETIKRIDDPHLEFYLFKNCASFTRITHLFRSLGPHPLLVEGYSKICQEMLSYFLGIEQFNDMKRASLKFKFGGIGLKCSSTYAEIAQLSSLVDSYGFFQLHFSDYLELYKKSVGDLVEKVRPFCKKSVFPKIELGAKVPGGLQSLLTKSLDVETLDSMVRDVDNLRMQALLNGVSTNFAGAWLSAVPCKQRDQYLSPGEFKMALRYWLGVPIFDSDSQCICGVKVDCFGDHVLVCKNAGLLNERHNGMRDLLVEFARLAGMSVKTETKGLLSGKERPADIYISNFNGTSQPALFDVSISSSLADSRLNKSARTRGSTAEAVVAHKLAHYKCQDGKIDTFQGKVRFVPLGAEALGGLSKNLRGLLLTFASQWALTMDVPKVLAFQSMIKRVSMRIQRANAKHLWTVHKYGQTEEMASTVAIMRVLDERAKWEWDPGESVQDYYEQYKSVELDEVENELLLSELLEDDDAGNDVLIIC